MLFCGCYRQHVLLQVPQQVCMHFPSSQIRVTLRGDSFMVLANPIRPTHPRRQKTTAGKSYRREKRNLWKGPGIGGRFWRPILGNKLFFGASDPPTPPPHRGGGGVGYFAHEAMASFPQIPASTSYCSLPPCLLFSFRSGCSPSVLPQMGASNGWP